MTPIVIVYISMSTMHPGTAMNIEACSTVGTYSTSEGGNGEDRITRDEDKLESHIVTGGKLDVGSIMHADYLVGRAKRVRTKVSGLLAMTDVVYGSLLDTEYDEMLREAAIAIFDQFF